MSADLSTRPVDWLFQLGEPVVALSGSPDSRHWAALGSEGNAAILDAATGRAEAQWAAHPAGGFRLAWHPRLDLIATSGADGKVRLWDSRTAALLHEMPGGSSWVEQLEWSPDGTLLATGAGRILTLWTPEGRALREWKNHKSTIAALCWRPDGLRLGAACYGGAQVYDPSPAGGSELLPWKTSLLSLAWSPDQRWVVAGTQDLGVQIWPQPFKLGDELQMSGYTAKVRELAWHRSSRYLATGGGEQIMVWDCSGNGPSGTSPRILDGHAALVSALAYQSQGFLLASGGQEGQVRFWNVKQSQTTRAFRIPGPVTALQWARSDQAVFVGGQDGSLAQASAPTT